MTIEKTRKFSWCPAGMEYSKRGGAAIYVRYGRFPQHKITLREKTSGHFWVQCPDRELVIVSNAQQAHAFRPMSSNYDECISLSPYHDHAAVDLNFDFLMTNYTSELGKEHTSAKTRTHGSDPTVKTKIISDSGGFQIYRGVIDYIDPEQLVQWYNDNTDYGMILDIPANIVGMKHHKRLAKIQAANTEIMMKHKRKDLELFNVFHGSNDAETELFRSITDRPDINRLAIGGGYWGTVLASVSRWYAMFLDKRKYKHYHVLGVQNVLQTIPLMKAACSGAAELITSDSTTHIQNAVAKGFYFHPSMADPPTFMSIGYRGNTPYKPNPYNTLPCTCSVCTVLKYKDIFSVLSGHSIDVMLTYHNLFATQKYFRAMYNVIESATTKELKEVLKPQFLDGKTKRSGIEEMFKALDFIDTVHAYGLDAARKKFSYYLPELGKYVNSNNTLFDTTKSITYTETPVTAEEYIKMNEYAVKYETKQGSHGKKINTKGMVSKIQSVKSTKKPGKKNKTKRKSK